MKICTDVDLGDVIMDAMFKFEKLQGFWCHWGQNSPFPIDFSRWPYHSAALPRCLWLYYFVACGYWAQSPTFITRPTKSTLEFCTGVVRVTLHHPCSVWAKQSFWTDNYWRGRGHCPQNLLLRGHIRLQKHASRPQVWPCRPWRPCRISLF